MTVTKVIDVRKLGKIVCLRVDVASTENQPLQLFKDIYKENRHESRWISKSGSIALFPYREVLTKDYRWVPVESIKPGAYLILQKNELPQVINEWEGE